MYIYMNTCIFIYIFINICIYTCIYVYIYVYICTIIYVYTYMCIHIYIWAYIYAKRAALVDAITRSASGTGVPTYSLCVNTEALVD